MAIYCMDYEGREDEAICQENAKYNGQKTRSGSIEKYYSCKVCGRRWKEVYSYEGIFDMAGNAL